MAPCRDEAERGDRRNKPQALRRRCQPDKGRLECEQDGKKNDTRMVRPTESSEEGWKVHQESEHRVVPVKVGNSTPEDPLEGRRCRVMELRKGNTTRDAKLD